MNRFNAVGLTVLFFVTLVFVMPGDATQYGFLVMGGYRYDNLRMFVATDSGVKGGPIADIMAISRHQLSGSKVFGVNIPIMRPILFGIAFEMLQFEPEVQLEFQSLWREYFSLAPSLGVSFHYGPDYKSDPDNPGPSFFAAGPIVGAHFLWGFTKNEAGSFKNQLGIKPYYTALFTENRGVGTVLGIVGEYVREF